MIEPAARRADAVCSASVRPGQQPDTVRPHFAASELTDIKGIRPEMIVEIQLGTIEQADRAGRRPPHGTSDEEGTVGRSVHRRGPGGLDVTFDTVRIKPNRGEPA